MNVPQGWKHPAAVLLLSLLAVGGRVHAELDANQIWTASGGEVRLELRADYLPDFGLEVIYQGQPVSQVLSVARGFSSVDHLVIEAPFGNFEGMRSGHMRLDTGWGLRHRASEVRLDELTLMPGIHINGHPSLEAFDVAGRHLLTFHHMHIGAEHDRELLTLHNTGISATPALADLLDLPALAGLGLGMAWFDLPLSVPAGADLSGRGPGCEDRPKWPQDRNEIDVAMCALYGVAYQGQDPSTGRIKLAPDATLKNVSMGDVPWIQKFGSLGGGFSYPYSPPDQHPYLGWSMYRLSDGRIEQLGVSGAKHAFLTLHWTCSINCGNMNVLWPGCEDVYWAGTNDSNFNQGPRSDIQASEGLFESTCSFFDPNCTGSQTQNSTSFQNRLMVDPGQLQTAGADYFLDSWYVVQYDVDIWNSMGYRRINPNPVSNGWSFGPLGTFTQGRVLDQWVNPANPGPNADPVSIVVPSATPSLRYPFNMPQGHINVAMRVSETGNGYRYRYAVQNYDFDRGVEAFRVPFPDDAELFSAQFVGVDSEPGDDWTVTVADGYLNFEAPANNPLSWFKLFTLEFETDRPPAATEITLDLGGDAVVPAWTEAMLGPDPVVAVIPDDAQLVSVFPAGSFTFPLALRHAGDGSGRAFVVERAGRIRIIDADNTVLATPFLDITAQVDEFFEGGLLGLAFHPDFASNGLFYVSFTSTGSPLTSRIVRFEVDSDNPNLADPSSQFNILSIAQPAGNHNGGDIHFGPDGLLYIGLGDGGPANQSQNLSTLLGNMLRIDVDNDDFPSDPNRNYAIPADNPFVGQTGLDEIWSYGLRNPYRFSFDRATGDLWIGDVGQATWEEINLQLASSAGGENYGWDVCEGAWQNGSTTVPCSLAGSTLPVIEYRRLSPQCSVTGGYRYRGPFPSLQGLYAYGDYCSGQVWLAREQGSAWNSEAFASVGFGIVGFGEDEIGHLYLLRSNGEVLRFVADSAPAPQLDSVSPDQGLESGGTQVSLAGAGFAPGTTVVFGANACQDVDVLSETEISCVTPAAAPGSVDVTVTNPDQQSDTLTAGFTYVPLPEPALSLNPPELAFGEVQLGEEASLEAELSNSGTATLTVSSIDWQGAPYSLDADDCGGVSFELAPEQSCVLSVSFMPDAVALYQDELLMVSNAASSPDSLGLTGSGIPIPGELAVEPMALDFGAVFEGLSETLAVVLSNVAEVGALDLDLSFAITDGNEAFAIDEAASDCDAELSAQTSCTLIVRFLPPAMAPYAGVLRVEADGNAQDVPLDGEGIELEPMIFDDRFEEPEEG
ncbi:MAG: PQQ-dependent sugar dehydrogenase [Wenzhouxiangella sp.]|nr:PQQ-dependent sugar dehydrogenase [Wenzhouxiangella sp.]